MTEITVHHWCGWYSSAQGKDEDGNSIPIVYALPAWAYRGWVIPDLKCPECGGTGVQLFRAEGKTLHSLDELPSFTIKVGKTKHGKHYQCYIDLQDWTYWGLDMLLEKGLYILANRSADNRGAQPIVWYGKVQSNRRIFVPADKFAPGEIIHIGLVF